MSSVTREALLVPFDAPLIEHPPLKALYSAWRCGGSKALALRQVMSQTAMLFVLLLFFVATVAIDYQQLQARLAHTICPGSVPNMASLFETDCYGNRPIDMHRRTHPVIIFVIAMVVMSMLWEHTLFHVSYRKLRSAERWWEDNRGTSLSQWNEWIEIASQLDGAEPDAVAAYGDFYGLLYSKVLKDFRHCSHNLHRFINVSVFLLLRWPKWRLSTIFAGMAVVSFVAMPYLAVNMLCRYFFRNFHSVRTKGVSTLIGRRKLSLLAKWRSHTEGDPPHVAERKAEQLETVGLRIIESLPTPKTVQTLLDAVLVCGGAFTALVLLLTVLLSEHVLTVDLTPGRTVAFYAAVVGVIIAAASAARAPHSPLTGSMTLRKLIVEMGPAYTAMCDEEAVAKVLSDIPYQAVTLVVEVASLLTTPWHLATTLRNRAQPIEDLVVTELM